MQHKMEVSGVGTRCPGGESPLLGFPLSTGAIWCCWILLRWAGRTLCKPYDVQGVGVVRLSS